MEKNQKKNTEERQKGKMKNKINEENKTRKNNKKP